MKAIKVKFKDGRYFSTRSYTYLIDDHQLPSEPKKLRDQILVTTYSQSNKGQVYAIAYFQEETDLEIALYKAKDQGYELSYAVKYLGQPEQN